jgi:CRISPR-associated Cas5-like protein
MIPTSVNHGLREAFLRALRDHLMRWDPAVQAVVDETCRRIFKLTFDEMLVRNPRFIAARTPRHVPPPSVLVPAIQHVYRTFGNALDAKTSLPLFSKQAWLKANAVLELAREGYLSDVNGVVLYEKAGIDKYGLQKYKCLRGTNKVEGGPHGDIYRKFGALHGMIFFCMLYIESEIYIAFTQLGHVLLLTV